MQTVQCPHCQAENVPGAAFCASCGKALPTGVQSGPRVVTGTAVPTTAAGMKLHTDELAKTAKSASGALLAVAIIQSICGAVGVAAGAASAARTGPRMETTILMATVLGVAVIFWALYIWSRWAPLPAAIVGLVVYVSLWVLDIIGSVAAMQSQSGAGGGAAAVSPLNGIVMRIVIIAVLVRAVKAGVRHRQILREQAGFPVVQ